MKDMIVRAYVTLLDADPAIWRRIDVPAGFTLKHLHDAIQTVMGWYDGHLHHFQIGGTLYGEPSPEDEDYDRKILNEHKLKLGTLAGDDERAFEYLYDYGDNWRCTVVLEAFTAAGPGITYLSLHCSAPGEVERLHPNDAAFRIAEYELCREPGFLAWVAGQKVALTGFRAIREVWRDWLAAA